MTSVFRVTRTRPSSTARISDYIVRTARNRALPCATSGLVRLFKTAALAYSRSGSRRTDLVVVRFLRECFGFMTGGLHASHDRGRPKTKLRIVRIPGAANPGGGELAEARLLCLKA